MAKPEHENSLSFYTVAAIVLFAANIAVADVEFPDVMPATRKLNYEGEIDKKLIAGVSRFLDAQLMVAPGKRNGLWQHSATEWPEKIEQHRDVLRKLLGMQEARPKNGRLELISTLQQSAIIATCEQFDVIAVRWNAFGQVHAEGLLLQPKSKVAARVVAIPDADQTPEELVSLFLLGEEETDGTTPNRHGIATLLACNGCQVLIPTIVSRTRGQFEWSGRRVDFTNREFLYRPAFELGRTLIGYEVQKVLAGIDCLDADNEQLPIGVVGWGEGGGLGLFTAALDERVQVACVSGYFAPRENVWHEPIDRNVFGLLSRFGDAELAAMVSPRSLIIEAASAPDVELKGGPGAPARLETPRLNDVQQEFQRAQKLWRRSGADTERLRLIVSGKDGTGARFCRQTRENLISRLTGHEAHTKEISFKVQRVIDSHHRLHRQMQQIDDHTQRLLVESPYVRKEYMKDLSLESVEAHGKTVGEYRRRFADDVIGKFDLRLSPANTKTRKSSESDKWVCYEVTLDVFPDVIAYGLLLIPKDIKPTEKRPVVVCQHGLEGRPQDVIGEESFHYYKAFAAKLAERGFITFAPQNLYRHRDEFRVLQRKANPLGKSLFSIITPQHQQIVNWLKTHPNVDNDRIAFYGLSYGGKTAMRVPALVTDYCLSICSADFNDWVGKTHRLGHHIVTFGPASTRSLNGISVALLTTPKWQP